MWLCFWIVLLVVLLMMDDVLRFVVGKQQLTEANASDIKIILADTSYMKNQPPAEVNHLIYSF